MSYKLNKTDGSLLIDLIDGVVDTDTTDLALVGKNFVGYGEYWNENFIKILENFANPNSPVSPLQGQLWYDTSENKLKVFDGTQFSAAAGSFVTDTFPNNPQIGDTWLKTSTQQFYVYTGNADDTSTAEASTGWVLIGPEFSFLQKRSGIIVDSVIDETSRARTVLRIDIGGVTSAIISEADFVPNIDERARLSGLVSSTNPNGRIYKGFNLVDPTGFIYRGTASRALSLESETGEELLAGNFIRKDTSAETMAGSLAVRNSAGVTIGASQNTRLLIDSGFVIKNQNRDEDFKIKINSSGSQLSELEALTLKSSTRRFGIFQTNPQYTFDLTGDLRVTGNLIVEGDQTSVDVSILQVEDKNIELGYNSIDGAIGNDAVVSGGGVILKSSDTDKTLVWENSTTSWTSSENIDIAAGNVYKIGGTEVLSATELAPEVTLATGLTRVGTLSELTVDNIQINNNVIQRLNGDGISIDAGPTTPTIDVNNATIQNVATPTVDADAANKVYVDQIVQLEPVIFSMDVTGWTAPDIVNQELKNLLDQLYPPSAFNNGKQARIPIYWYETQSTNIDIANDPGTDITDKANVLGYPSGDLVSVLQNVTLPTNLAVNIQPAVERDLRIFEIVNGVWELQP